MLQVEQGLLAGWRSGSKAFYSTDSFYFLREFLSRSKTKVVFSESVVVPSQCHALNSRGTPVNPVNTQPELSTKRQTIAW